MVQYAIDVTLCCCVVIQKVFWARKVRHLVKYASYALGQNAEL